MIGLYLLAIVVTVLMVLTLPACSTVSMHRPEVVAARHKTQRVTFYHRFEDRFGSHTSAGVRAKEGITVAAPPYLALGTKLQIPALSGIVGNGNFVVQDRGRAVRRFDRIDVYVEAGNRREARRRLHMLAVLPPLMEVLY